MKQITRKEFLELFDPEVHDQISTALGNFPDATAVVCFENQDMWSSQLGARTSLVVGPSNTFKSAADCEGKWLNDLPSQRQYPTVYVPASEFKA